MKNVVIIGGDFAPSSLPPSVRIRFFARHLPEFGWNPIVITTDPAYYECAIDPENEALIPPELEVLRTKAIPPAVSRRMGFSDIGMRSLWHHWRRAVKLCRERRIDLLFIPVPPYLGMVLGRLLHMQFGIPYVIDYIDPWVIDYYWTCRGSSGAQAWAGLYHGAPGGAVCDPQGERDDGSLAGNQRQRIGAVQLAEEVAGGVGGNSLRRRAGGLRVSAAAPAAAEDFRPAGRADPFQLCGGVHPADVSDGEGVVCGGSRGAATKPELFGRLRLHFVGTSYAPAQDGVQVTAPLAEVAASATW